MTDLLQPYASDREADRGAREWLDNLNHQAAVGARHHIVPRFLLARFASAEGRIRVRNRSDGKASIRSIGDMAQRDFYTTITKDAELGSSLESILSTVEGGAAEILRQRLDFRGFMRPRAFTAEERAILDAFVAFQAVRGMRMRRSIEIIADYGIKLLHQEITEEDIRALDFVPHPNDHLRMIGHIAERTEEALKTRSASLIRLGKPLLIIGDEPVLTVNEGDESGHRDRTRPDMASSEFVLLEGGRGFAYAESIMLPLTPSTVLAYGPPHHNGLPAEIHLTGAEAESFAEEVNQLILESAIEWVAASPGHPAFTSLAMPPPQPLLTVHDYGSLAAARVNSTPAHRPIRRLRPDDILEAGPAVAGRRAAS